MSHTYSTSVDLSLLICSFFSLFVLGCTSASAQESTAIVKASDVVTGEDYEELGGVRWMRDFERARARAERESRPLLVLFTEIPGCSTVKGFGHGALRDPIVIEAITAHFVPVVIYNNRPGRDADLLASFEEPAWNNPVVRAITPDRRPLAERFSGPYEAAPLLDTMRRALDVHAKSPAWLSLVAGERASRKRGTERATLSMYCFWSGEAKLGEIEGVVGSRTGFEQGREVVEIEYDPGRISYAELMRKAHERGAATGAITRTEAELASASEVFGARAVKHPTRAVRRSLKDDKKQIERSALRWVPMTEAQASRVNALAGRGDTRGALRFLSPTQRALYQAIRQHPDRAWPDPREAKSLKAAWAASTKAAQIH